jgi:hypothetical protein
MKTLKGTVKGGQIALSEPVLWPEGTEVRVRPIDMQPNRCEQDIDDQGAGEDDREDNPQSIALWIAEFDAIPPLQMSSAEEAQWQAARSAQREFEKAGGARRIAGLGSTAE